MMSKQLQSYQNNSVNTASGPQLTLMLYNGCIRFINQGIKALEKNDYELKNKQLQKAQDIIRELMITLDPEVEISKQMMSLYDYILRLLQEGNIKNNIEQIEEALGLITEFRDTWKEAMKQEAPNYVQGAQV
ncbi:MAG TPA: flagellar export chaperone FliS [Pseudogracilibacillus sp.]|nr:flagellar export chaperone FliS [Pseudogracilibacillus sp.]